MAGTGTPPGTAPDPAPQAVDRPTSFVEVRVLSYNVRSLRDDTDALVRVIRACQPDVVCVQEAPRFFRWRAKAAALARSCGLYVITGGRPAGAMLLLGSPRTRVLWSGDVLLTRTPGLHQRGLAMAVLGVAGTTFGVASMHLSLVAAERRRLAEEVLAEVAGLARRSDGPVVLAGDVNEAPGAPAWSRLAAELVDAWAVAPAGGEFTSPASRPRQRIDAVFVGGGIEVVACGVPAEPATADIAAATDHTPVLAVLRVPQDAAAPSGSPPGS